MDESRSVGVVVKCYSTNEKEEKSAPHYPNPIRWVSVREWVVKKQTRRFPLIMHA
jgi:hypothetical protein